MRKLVLLRHGQSVWNEEDRFTGWTDVDLSQTGIAEAKKAGQTLREEGYSFDTAFTSVLKRAIRTLWIVLDEMDLMWIPVELSWRLNEKHYGALQGLNKGEMAAKVGEEQVHIWRRSYDVQPPSLERTDSRYPGFDARYRGVDERELPTTESLKDTVDRFLPYWRQAVAPAITSGKRVLISAHGNSLRALVKHLDCLTGEEIANYNIPTGIPLVYELDDNLSPLRSHYLAPPDEVERAMKTVEQQGKAR